MALILYEQVALTRDLPDLKLKAGDVATLVDLAEPTNAGDERGCVLEVFNALGETLTVVVVPESAVERLRGDQVPAVRTTDTSN
jgi:hypothetical protein